MTESKVGRLCCRNGDAFDKPENQNEHPHNMKERGEGKGHGRQSTPRRHKIGAVLLTHLSEYLHVTVVFLRLLNELLLQGTVLHFQLRFFILNLLNLISQF